MPNWYLGLKEAGFKDKFKEIARPAVMMAPLGLFGLVPNENAPARPSQPPISLEQPRTHMPKTPPASKPSSQPDFQPSTKQTMAPLTTVEPSGNIDVKKIIQMESSGRADAESDAGAAGLMQVMPATWEDIAGKIGQFQGFEKWKFDEKANVAIGSYYMNTEIPRLLKSAALPDTIDTRLAAYNCGVGNLKKIYQKHGKDWKSHLPGETANYIKKYHG